MTKTSKIEPEQVSIEQINDTTCNIIVRTNIMEEPDDNEETYFSYDEYVIPLQWQSDLLEQVLENLDEWVVYGKTVENTPDTTKELSDKGKISVLLRENETLKALVATLESDNELLKGCVMELADEVFA